MLPLLTPAEQAEWEGWSLDGKTQRGGEERGSLHMLSVFSQRLEAVLGQQAMGSKKNEIPEARLLLKTFTLDGRLITADALHTQRETAQVILEKREPI